MSKNKIVDYYKPSDERLGEYYFGHIKMLGLDKQPYGLDEHGTLRFEEIESGKVGASSIWKDYVDNGNFENGVGDYNKLWMDFQKGKYTIEEFMQFYREDGCSLCHLIDVWSERFYAVEDEKEFQKALDKLKETKELNQAKDDIMDTLFLAHMDSVGDEIILEYRKEAKKIIDKNFGEGTWKEFVTSIRNKKN